jgi:hypothetical protein
MNSKRILWIALILSLLAHLLVLLFFPHLSKIDLRALKQEPQAIEDKRITFEFIETPDVPEDENVEKQNLVSDKNIAAADELDRALPIDVNPFSEGDMEFKEFPETESVEMQQENEPEESVQETPEQESPEQSDETVVMENNEKQIPRVQPESVYLPPQPDYNNVMSEVEKAGGVSFNTYNWNFAPYMLYLKKKIQGNLNPPPGFTYLGLIHGDVLVRFIILPNGTLKDVKVLHSEAHNSLVQASTGSITISAPFLPLPKDFPEDYLVVTSLFSYIVEKKYK